MCLKILLPKKPQELVDTVHLSAHRIVSDHLSDIPFEKFVSILRVNNGLKPGKYFREYYDRKKQVEINDRKNRDTPVKANMIRFGLWL